MTNVQHYLLDTIRSMVRVGFLAGVLYLTASNFDDTEATVIGTYAAAEAGLRSFDWLKKKE